MYLALTMPLCIYSCKANYLFNTYMKMGRNEGCLCVINIGAMLLNVGFAFIGIHVFGSVEIATCGIIATVVLRDLTFEGFMARIHHDSYVGSCLSEALITTCFMLASWTLGLYSLPIVILILFGYLFVSKNELRLVASMVREKFCAGVAR